MQKSLKIGKLEDLCKAPLDKRKEDKRREKEANKA